MFRAIWDKYAKEKHGWVEMRFAGKMYLFGLMDNYKEKTFIAPHASKINGEKSKTVSTCGLVVVLIGDRRCFQKPPSQRREL